MFFPMNWINANLKLVITAILVALVVLGGAGYFIYQQSLNQPANLSPDAAAQAASKEVRQLVSEVGKLIALPEGEDPTVATVTDISKLKDQPFFAKAKNGDKVLIYTQAKKAILYDPVAKKILDVAPVNIGSPSAQQAIKVVLRNGTKTTGLTSKVEADVKKSIPNVNILTKENAGKDDYEKTLVVVLNDTFKAEAEKLTKDLGVEVGDLPEGESKPKEGDILVILGKDKIQ